MKSKYIFVASMLAAILVVSLALTTFYVNRYGDSFEVCNSLNENDSSEKNSSNSDESNKSNNDESNNNSSNNDESSNNSSNKNETNNHSSKDDSSNNQLVIVTSFYPMFIATANIAKDVDNVTVTNLSEPKTGCLHDYQLTPKDMKLLSKADVFVVNGGGIESFLTKVSESYPDLKIVNASEEVELISEEEDTAGLFGKLVVNAAESGSIDITADNTAVDNTTAENNVVGNNIVDDNVADNTTVDGNVVEDEEESEVNAHAWMSVADYRVQVATIKEKLSKIDPANAERYQSNFDKYDGSLAELEKKQSSIKEKIAGENVIIFHEAYEYLAKDYGLNVVYTMDLDEERQVSAGEVKDVLRAIEKYDVKVILAEKLYGSDMAETVMKESDVEVIYIDALNRGDYSLEDYLVGMSDNIELVEEGFKK